MITDTKNKLIIKVFGKPHYFSLLQNNIIRHHLFSYFKEDKVMALVVELAEENDMLNSQSSRYIMMYPYYQDLYEGYLLLLHYCYYNSQEHSLVSGSKKVPEGHPDIAV